MKWICAALWVSGLCMLALAWNIPSINTWEFWIGVAGLILMRISDLIEDNDRYISKKMDRLSPQWHKGNLSDAGRDAEFEVEEAALRPYGYPPSEYTAAQKREFFPVRDDR